MLVAFGESVRIASGAGGRPVVFYAAGSDQGPQNPYVKTVAGPTLRRASPNIAFVQRASNLQLLGSLGSYVVSSDGALVVSDDGAYVYNEA